MPSDQTLIFALFGILFVLLVWGRFRYDLVAFGALIAAAALGLVPSSDVFSGFGHSAVAIIALVLIVSKGLSSSGAVEMAAARLIDPERPLPLHIAIISAVAAGMSAIINNVAALALLMPLDIEAANKGKRNPGQSLMPLSFATILGGMITLIGTPPNIVISEYRQDALGAPFAMFDFAPVGLAVAVAGIAFVSIVGWRMLPSRTTIAEHETEVLKGRYVAELRVGEQTFDQDVAVRDLYPKAEDADINILGLVRSGRRRPGLASREVLRPGDFLGGRGRPEVDRDLYGPGRSGIRRIRKAFRRRHRAGTDAGRGHRPGEVRGSRIGPRAASLSSTGTRSRLLGVARGGQRFRDRVRLLTIRAGDVLLLLGTPERLSSAMDWLGVLPIEGRQTEVLQRRKAGLSIGVFIAAVGLAVAGLLVAFSCTGRLRRRLCRLGTGQRTRRLPVH